MDKIADLMRDLRQFEESQFKLVKEKFVGFSFRCRDMCYGTAQFVVVQEPSENDRIKPESILPVICVIGSNCYQMDRTGPCPTTLEHYLACEDPVTDRDLHRGMRNPLDLSLAAHNRNASAWVTPERIIENCRADAELTPRMQHSKE